MEKDDINEELLDKYLKLAHLLNKEESWLPRLEKVHETVLQPDFQYDAKSGAHIFIANFIQTSYWLDTELFDESYIYTKGYSDAVRKENLGYLEVRYAHLKMVDIGVSLLDKGFPLEYNRDDYRVSENGNDFLNIAHWVKTFVKQCHKKHSLCHKVAQHNRQKIVKDNPNTRV